MTKAEMIAKVLNKFNLTAAAAEELVEAVETGAEFQDDTFETLFSFYCNSGDMPYGVAKARDGDPHQWIHNALCEELEIIA